MLYPAFKAEQHLRLHSDYLQQGQSNLKLMGLCAGRLYKSKHLRKKGEVRYNGHSRREFNMARTIAMVDQLDQHIANLSVRETLEFAHHCQVGLPKTCPVCTA